MSTSFAAIRVHMDENRRATAAIERCERSDLPAGEVEIRVDASTVNYKDALSLRGRPGVTRSYPHTPGIDAVGHDLGTGEAVIVQGTGFGVDHWGAFSEIVRVPREWVFPLPDGLSAESAMAYGTAGLTAALSVRAIAAARASSSQSGMRAAVTGASGGVGSCAVAMLAQSGYEVVAVTGKAGDAAVRERLEALGAATVMARDEFEDTGNRPMVAGSYDVAVDSAGGATLAALLARSAPRAVVTCCGLTAGAELATTVFPFILRGVSLIGIDSSGITREERQAAWNALASELCVPQIEAEARRVALADVPAVADALLDGSHSGRTIVSIASE